MAQHWYEQSEIAHFLTKTTGASQIVAGEVIQELWSGYGEIRRLHLKHSNTSTETPAVAADRVIAKWVAATEKPNHPRGWNTSKSHQRKLHSYQVERTWYEQYASLCDGACPVAQYLGSKSEANGYLLLLSDLDYEFPQRFTSAHHQVTDSHTDQLSPVVTSCLRWLADFHARFYDSAGGDLWPQGTYWYLDTRADEYDVMQAGRIKDIAHFLDKKLRYSPHQTLVHGDAKIANFCFTPAGDRVAAVDFQYVGRGVGVRDVAYFLGSCLNETELMERDQNYLDFYFDQLSIALQTHQPAINFLDVCSTWRELYPIAWTDFYRFLLGWMPSHPKTHSYTRQLADAVLADIDQH